MHGRVKVRTSAEQEKIKELERQKKAAEYRKVVDTIFEKRKDRDNYEELLLLTEKLLTKYPDVYTLWNIRKDCFTYCLFFYKWSDKEYFERLDEELTLTEVSLRENPKSYCAWYHRAYVFNEIPNKNYEKELNLCNKCLDYDERNFHCWDYRSFIIKKAKIPDEKELKFTESKIFKNFSNYSAWHYRSRLLTKLYPSKTLDLSIRADKHDEELDLVMNATFTDPKDSSAWFYQFWLLNYWKTPSNLWQAILSDNKITAAFHTEDCPCFFELFVNDKKIKYDWKSVNGKKYSIMWCTKLEESLFDESEIALKSHGVMYHLKKSSSSKEWIYRCEPFKGNQNNAKLKEPLDKYKELLKMEPNNKWVRLNNAHLMLNYNPIELHSDIMKEWEDLITIDPLRENYYKDMRSKCALEYNLNSIVNNENTNDVIRTVDLSNLELTSLHSQEPYLAFFHEVNFSNNHLGSKLHQFYTLQQCKKLNLSSNAVSSLKTLPKLESLKILLLTDNEISESAEILDLIKGYNLEKLDLKGNPIPDVDSLVSEIQKLSPSLEVVI